VTITLCRRDIITGTEADVWSSVCHHIRPLYRVHKTQVVVVIKHDAAGHYLYSINNITSNSQYCTHLTNTATLVTLSTLRTTTTAYWDKCKKNSLTLFVTIKLLLARPGPGTGTTPVQHPCGSVLEHFPHQTQSMYSIRARYVAYNAV